MSKNIPCIILSTFFCLLLFLTTLDAQTQRNPYQDFYKTGSSWTDSIAWNRVVNVLKVKGLVNGNRQVDSLVLSTLMDSISMLGGGVIYFPSGTYYFNHDVYLKNGIILRGADPIGETSAKAKAFAPPTKLEFPQYIPRFSGRGTPNNTAFKIIGADSSGIKNAGLVNLDVNRARIVFFATLTRQEEDIYHQGATVFPIHFHSNILIFGVRQNNAAAPDPNIPTNFMIDEGQAWQRWPHHGGPNIDLLVKRNCIIANCRLNDKVTDNFDQPNYIVHSGYKIQGPKAKFKFDAHTAIWVNVRTFEKLNIFEGIEINDNFIVTSSYWDKIIVRGNDPVITNNVDNAYFFSNDLDVDYDGQWELDLKWKKYADNDTLFRKLKYLTSTSDTIPYRLLTPKTPDKNTKLPLILFLHGVGEHGKDNSLQLKHFIYYFGVDSIQRSNPCFVLAPQIPLGRQWIENEKEGPLTDILHLMNNIINAYPIDKERLYVVGVSSGANAALKSVSLYPKVFASAIALCSMVNYSERELKNIKNTSIGLFYGTEDTHVPFKHVEFFANRLKKSGVPIKLSSYKDSAHAIWTKVGEDPEFYSWLFAQKK